MVASFSNFTATLELVFALTFENTFFFRTFVLNQTERAYVLLQNDTGDFQNSPPFDLVYLLKQTN